VWAKPIAGVITSLHKTGTHPTLEAMRQELPAGVLELLSIPGLRPEKVLKLHKTLGISSLAELEQAARADKIKSVKGLGPAFQGIELGRSSKGKRHLHRAAALLHAAEDHLRRAHPDLKRIAPAGEFRRGCGLVSDLSLVVEAKGISGRGITSGSELTIH
jgi:DNA polymerase (family 10)